MSTIDRTLKTGGMTAAELLPLIDPKLHPKFSPNLHAWIKKHFEHWAAPLVVTSPDNFPGRYIAAISDDKWMIGARLNQVLCNGRTEKKWALSHHHPAIKGGFDTEFFSQYIKDGRCAIDPEHTVYFTNESTRWAEEKHQRHCQWCNHHTQVKLTWSETIKLSEWVQA